jgi:hypothetical protein
MAKKGFLLGMLALALVFGLMVVGCGTVNGGRYASDSPVENDCTLTMKGSSAPNLPNTKIPHITSLDGTEVDWKGEFSGMSFLNGKGFSIQIPAGEHTLSGRTESNTNNSGPVLTTSFNFVAGHTYKVEIKDALQFIDTTK